MLADGVVQSPVPSRMRVVYLPLLAGVLSYCRRMRNSYVAAVSLRSARAFKPKTLLAWLSFAGHQNSTLCARMGNRAGSPACARTRHEEIIERVSHPLENQKAHTAHDPLAVTFCTRVSKTPTPEKGKITGEHT